MQKENKYTNHQEHVISMMWQWHHTHQELLKLKDILFQDVSTRTQLHINTFIDNADKQFKYWQEEFGKSGALDVTINKINSESINI